jgi:ribosomal protein S27AE
MSHGPGGSSGRFGRRSRTGDSYKAPPDLLAVHRTCPQCGASTFRGFTVAPRVLADACGRCGFIEPVKETT